MNKQLVITIFFLLSLTGCATSPYSFSPPAVELPKQFVERQILVTLPYAIKPQWKQIARLIAQDYELELSGEFPLTSIAVNCLVFKTPEKLVMSELLQRLRLDSRISWAQENLVFEGLQGRADNIYSELSYAPKLMHATTAHRLSTGLGVKIAVIDTGADIKHPDLQGGIISITNFVEGGELSFSTDQHGTAIAGIIGAQSDNSIGIVGIAPKSEILIMKSCWYSQQTGSGAKCSSWTLAKAIDAAINKGVKIINLSLAGPHDKLLESLLDKANQHGITIVTASLDKLSEPGFPATLHYVIPAVSSDPKGAVILPKWLSQIPAVVAAPGIEIVATTPHGKYDILSGTSMAAAHISGTVALLLEYDPTLKPDTIKRMLIEDSITSHQYRSIDVSRLLVNLDENNPE